MNTEFWSGNLKEGDHSEELGVDGKLKIIMDLGKIGWGVVERMHLAQDRDQLGTVLNTAMNLRV